MLALKQSSSGPKMLYNVHAPDGSIVQLFPIHGEDHLKQLAQGMQLRSGWKWTRNSVVFGTLSDSGVILIWDLLTRRTIMRLEVKGTVNCLWAHFLTTPNDNLFLFIKDKLRLSYTELSEQTSVVSHLRLVSGVEHMTGFCTPQLNRNHLIYPNGAHGIAAIGFSPYEFSLASKDNGDGLVISELLPAPDTNRGMVVILVVIVDWLVIAYEDGYVTIYNFASGQVMYNCDLKEHYGDEDDQSVTPMPMTCAGSAHFGKVVIAVAGVRPRLFILDMTTTQETSPFIVVPSIIYLDGCSDLATCPESKSPEDRMDMIAISGLSGSLDVYRLSDCSHLVNIPHREKIIRKLMFIPKSIGTSGASKTSNSESKDVEEEILLLYASDSSLSLWNLF